MLEQAVRESRKHVDPASWLDEHGDHLFRYALTRVRRAEVAEDLVQETFLAALQAKNRFKGAAAERTWLIGILKHKIVDHLRRSQREQPASNVAAMDKWAEGLFDKRGRWKKPGNWPANPSAALERKEFWDIFSRCLDKLPERAAKAFVLRVMDGVDSAEICKILAVTATNFWVILHRARLALWRCLEINWFDIKRASQ